MLNKRQSSDWSAETPTITAAVSSLMRSVWTQSEIKFCPLKVPVFTRLVQSPPRRRSSVKQQETQSCSVCLSSGREEKVTQGGDSLQPKHIQLRRSWKLLYEGSFF